MLPFVFDQTCYSHLREYTEIPNAGISEFYWLDLYFIQKGNPMALRYNCHSFTWTTRIPKPGNNFVYSEIMEPSTIMEIRTKEAEYILKIDNGDFICIQTTPQGYGELVEGGDVYSKEDTYFGAAENYAFICQDFDEGETVNIRYDSSPPQPETKQPDNIVSAFFTKIAKWLAAR